MAQVSKKKLDKDVWLKVHKQFMDSILKLKGNSIGHSFLEEFFTDTERIMFAKRLAIIVMLCENIPHSSIAQLLGITRTTVYKFAKILDRGGFKSLRYILKHKKDVEAFWKQIEKLSRGGLPPYAGRGRWSYLYKETQHLQPKKH